MSEEEKEIERRRNASIMPHNYSGRPTEEVGLFKYIDFDKHSNEIKMEIPLSKLLSPEENKRLREEI